MVAPNIHRAKPQELLSQQATSVIPQASSVTQRYHTAVLAHQRAEEQHVAAIKVRAKADKQRIEGRNKWWELGGNLRDTKRHFRREAADYGNPNGSYCNVGQIADGVHALKRGRANKRREQPPKHHSSKHPQASTTAIENEPIFSGDATDRAPASIGASPPKFHEHQSKFIEMFEAPYQPVGRLKNHVSSTRNSATCHPLSTTLRPLRSFDINVVLSGGAQKLHQADAVEDLEDGNNSLDDNAEQVRAPDSSLWFGERTFFPSQSPGSN